MPRKIKKRIDLVAYENMLAFRYEPAVALVWCSRVRNRRSLFGFSAATYRLWTNAE